MVLLALQYPALLPASSRCCRHLPFQPRLRPSVLSRFCPIRLRSPSRLPAGKSDGQTPTAKPCRETSLTLMDQLPAIDSPLMPPSEVVRHFIEITNGPDEHLNHS